MAARRQFASSRHNNNSGDADMSSTSPWKMNVSCFACAMIALVATSFAQTTQLQRVSPSLVAVQWTWAYEYGRMDFVGAGIVVRDDGLIVIPMQVVDPGIPDVQMTDF